MPKVVETGPLRNANWAEEEISNHENEGGGGGGIMHTRMVY